MPSGSGNGSSDIGLSGSFVVVPICLRSPVSIRLLLSSNLCPSTSPSSIFTPLSPPPCPRPPSTLPRHRLHQDPRSKALTSDQRRSSQRDTGRSRNESPHCLFSYSTTLVWSFASSPSNRTTRVAIATASLRPPAPKRSKKNSPFFSVISNTCPKTSLILRFVTITSEYLSPTLHLSLPDRTWAWQPS